MATRAQLAQQKKAFLEAFRRCGIITRACEASGVARRTVYSWQEHDEHFLADFHEAETIATEVLESEMHRRAVEGVDKPVYQGGKLVGTVTEYSDTLLIFALKARDPKYREVSRHEHTGKDGEPLSLAVLLQRAREYKAQTAEADAVDAHP